MSCYIMGNALHGWSSPTRFAVGSEDVLQTKVGKPQACTLPVWRWSVLLLLSVLDSVLHICCNGRACFGQRMCCSMYIVIHSVVAFGSVPQVSSVSEIPVHLGAGVHHQYVSAMSTHDLLVYTKDVSDWHANCTTRHCPRIFNDHVCGHYSFNWYQWFRLYMTSRRLVAVVTVVVVVVATSASKGQFCMAMCMI